MTDVVIRLKTRTTSWSELLELRGFFAVVTAKA